MRIGVSFTQTHGGRRECWSVNLNAGEYDAANERNNDRATQAPAMVTAAPPRWVCCICSPGTPSFFRLSSIDTACACGGFIGCATEYG